MVFAAAGCGSSGSNGGSSTTTPTSTTDPTPTVTSVAPTTLTAGAGVTTLTVTGTGFVKTTSVQVGGVVEPTTYVSATQVTAQVAASQLASGGTLNVIALNNGGTSASGAQISLEVDNPAPTITGFTPAMVATGSVATTLSVTGTGFVPTTTIQVNGAARSTTYVSGTQVNVNLTTADLATAGTVSLVAVNAAPGGGSSAASSVAVNNPVPGLLAVAPATVLSGATAPQTVTITGSRFVPGSVVQVNGTGRPTTVVSGTQLTFQLSVADQATSAVLKVAVANPAPGGGVSRTTLLDILQSTPTPVISAVTPNSFVIGSGNAQIQVSGTNLNYNSTVLWNGTALQTSYGYNGSAPYGYFLYAAVPASLLSAVGTANVTVSSASSSPAVSNALPVTVTNPPMPTVTGLSPNAGPLNTAQTLQVTGTGFTSNSVVQYNGTALATTFSNSGSLSAVLPATSVALPGNGTVTVVTPAPGGGTSTGSVFTAYIAIANNSMVYNPVNGLLYVSVPSSAGAPYGNSVVSVDPATGALGTPIPVGSEPNKLALTTDGRYLWVGLDGAAAVRKVDLMAGTAGLQFSLAAVTQYQTTATTALALAAIPGQTDSVVVSQGTTYSQYGLGIYDAGALRGTQLVSYANSGPLALAIDGTRNELYAVVGGNYTVYSYGASGLTQLATGSASTTAGTDDLQVTGGLAYLDAGAVLNAETGQQEATLYSSGTTIATGPTFADTTLGKIFVLDGTSNYTSPSQIQVFSATQYTSNGSAIPVNPVSVASSNLTTSNYPSHLVRWGANGLAFRTTAGVFSLQSNLVKDLSATSADLQVSLAASGGTATGTNTTYTATVTNAGPDTVSKASLAAFLPSTGSLVSVTPAAGSCSTSSGLSCDLGSLPSGASTTVNVVVTQTTAGSSTVNVQVASAENDPALANNQASASAAVAGATFTVAPTLSAVAPAFVSAGSGDTVVTVSGTGFTTGSTVQVGGTALPTAYVSATQLTSTVPAATLTTLGWAPVTVTTPAPGGGTTGPLPLSVVAVLPLGLNHVLYDPYSRKLVASVGSDSTELQGNSVVAITPETAAVGTPVAIGSQPEAMALTGDGQILYTVLQGNQGIARFNMLTQQAEFTYLIPGATGTNNNGVLGITAQPGTENTVAIALGYPLSEALYDFDPAHQTAAVRGSAIYFTNDPCAGFPDANHLLADTFASGQLTVYSVSAQGLAQATQQGTNTLNSFGCFKLNGGVATSVLGGVASVTSLPPVQLGTFAVPGTYSYGVASTVAPDRSLGRTFFAVNGSGSYAPVNTIAAFDNGTYVQTGTLALPLSSQDLTSTPNVSDLVRWGQDGLALLTSTGNLYLLRGPAVVPGLLGANSAAVLASASTTSIAHGSGNTVLTLTGSNFLPGVAVTWNGGYRTTTIVDATHVTVDLPAGDLATAGTGTLIAVNPGAPASGALQVAVQ